jgi:hypothetical protein
MVALSVIYSFIYRYTQTAETNPTNKPKEEHGGVGSLLMGLWCFA